MNLWIYLGAIFAGVTAIAMFLTARFRVFAERRAIFDMPNARSLHAQPTPRGGGIIIVLCVFTAVLVLFASGALASRLAVAFIGGGGLVAAAGWLDDRYGLDLRLRAVVYVLAAGLAVSVLGAGDVLPVIYDGLVGDMLVGLVLVLAIVWCVNLYNFMDGTDGLAAQQGIIPGLVMGIMFGGGGYYGLAVLCIVIAAAIAGFLRWNWPPARIFMGDVGSCFLGFCFAVLGLESQRTAILPWTGCYILFSLFLCDATFTLLRRVCRGEKWYSAHRTHAYQLLVQHMVNRQQLLLVYIGVNTLLLAPMVLIGAGSRSFLTAAAVILTIAWLVLWGVVQYKYLAA